MSWPLHPRVGEPVQARVDGQPPRHRRRCLPAERQEGAGRRAVAAAVEENGQAGPDPADRGQSQLKGRSVNKEHDRIWCDLLRLVRISEGEWRVSQMARRLVISKVFS